MEDKKIKTLIVIEKELTNRVRLMKNATINIKVALYNQDYKALDVIGDNYSKKLDEMQRMLNTMDKILKELE